ncbi:MAG: radical SAM protein [Thermodesulfobacteriota bacterium]
MNPLSILRKGGRFLRSALSGSCWYLIFSVTGRCNQRCRMCFNWRKAEDNDQLSIDEIERIAPQFTSLFQLTLSGGEPILRDDVVDIVKLFNRARPVPRITLPSNGQLPERLEKVVRQLAAALPESNINVALSLDGVGSLHDHIRGVPGAFERHKESRARLDRLRGEHPNVSTVVASVYSSYNKDRFDELLGYIAQQDRPEIHGIMFARGDTRDAQAKVASREDFIARMNQLRGIQLPRASRFQRAWTSVYHANRVETMRGRRMVDPCRAGDKLLVIDHKGTLSPCEVMEEEALAGEFNYPGPYSYGSLRESGYSVDALLHAPRGRALTSFIRRGGCHCTFECALLNNFPLNPRNYFRCLSALLLGGKESPGTAGIKQIR